MKRRKKYLFGHRYRNIFRFSDIRKLSLSPNDILVFSYPMKEIFCHEDLQKRVLGLWKALIENIEKKFPGSKVVLLDSDIDMVVLSSEEFDKKHKQNQHITK